MPGFDETCRLLAGNRFASLPWVHCKQLALWLLIRKVICLCKVVACLIKKSSMEWSGFNR